MDNLPISSKYRSRAADVADDAEREAVASRVNDAYVAAAIDADQYRELLDRTYAARTLGELAPVVENLPALRTHAEPAIVEQRGHLAPGELSPAGLPPAGPRIIGVVIGSVVALMFVVGILIAVLG